MRFNPKEYQGLGIDFLSQMERTKLALLAQPGMGKTVVAETVIDKLRMLDQIGKTIVFMPKRVLDTEGWQRERLKWDHLRDLGIEAITGTAAQRREKLRSPAPIHLINFELVPWLLDELITCWPYDMGVADESTKVKSYKSTWFRGNPRSKQPLPIGTVLRLPNGRSGMLEPGKPIKVPGNTRVQMPYVDARIDVESVNAPDLAFPSRQIIQPPEPRVVQFEPTAGLLHVAAKSKRWINLTGTPMPGGVDDLWSQVYLLDEGKRLGRNITAFREQFMQPHPRVKNVWLEQPNALPRVIARVEDICLSLKAKDWLPIDDPIPTVVDVALDPATRAAYDQLEEEFYLRLEEGVVEAANAAVLTNKLLQFTSGFLFTGGDHFREIHRYKIEALEDLIDEVGGPMLIGYHYKPNRLRLLKHFKTLVEFDGTRRQISDFAAGKIKHLLIHPASGGHGVDGLQDATNTLVFYESDWSLDNHDQLIERIGPTRQYQSGHPRPVLLYYLAVQNSADHLVLQRLIERRDTQDIFMDALKRRRK